VFKVYDRFKRCADIFVAMWGLIILSPTFGLIAVLIRLDSSGPVLYIDERLGLRGKRFKMFKFRSMYASSVPHYAVDGSMLVGKDDPRITRVGRFLRLGFDELPQLWNVLRGEMSLVGPRPDLPHALELYQGDEGLRLSVRPGITGLAQVMGRTDIPWQERLEYDIDYVRRRSCYLDMQIIILTILELIPALRSSILRNRLSRTHTP
jgi:undecaprenyl phosphate N,N'-diacetylbacillosamine 1-phosphate transferase